MLRFITTAVILGLVTAGIVEVVEVNTGWRQDWVMPVVLAALIGLWAWYEFRYARVSTASPVSSENLHRVLFQLAVALLSFVLGMVGVSWLSGSYVFIPAAFAVIGLIAFVPAMVRWMAFIKAARENPTLMDERIIENAGKSERWAFLASLEIALILGMVDHLDVLPISGATVGFSVAISGVFTGVASQAYFEWRDGK